MARPLGSSPRRSVLVLATLTLAAAVALPRGGVADAGEVLATPAVEPLAFFGGRKASIRLPSMPHDTQTHFLRAQLVQRSASLAMPVGSAMAVRLVPGAIPEIDVELPRVSQSSDFELRVESRAEDDWRPAGRVALRLYPDDLLAPLRSFAARRDLRVVEDDGQLAALLERFRIPFRERGSPPNPRRKAAPVTLYAGRPARETPIRSVAVVFAERERGLPHLVVTELPEGKVIRVEMQLLSRLESDPRSQQTLLEIFELLEQPTS